MGRYLEDKEMYAKIGIDTDKAIKNLKNVPIALHCWQCRVFALLCCG